MSTEFIPSEEEGKLIRLFRFDSFESDSTDQDARLRTLRRMHEEELDREWRGKGYRTYQWYPKEFIESLYQDIKKQDHPQHD